MGFLIGLILFFPLALYLGAWVVREWRKASVEDKKKTINYESGYLKGVSDNLKNTNTENKRRWSSFKKL